MAKDPNLSVALVTGAASGIGQELAHLLARDQYQLILVDQHPSRGQSEKADPRQVAHDGYDAMMKGEARIVSGLSNKLKATMSNVLLDSWLMTIAEPRFEKQS